jgi:tRNA-2-methylthio-N6-dimethylallyladenosine synthase
MQYFIQTFGCQMNVHDSRRMEEVLIQAGYQPADTPSEASVVVLNTCSVREKAEHKLMSALGRLKPLKALRRDAVIVVAGCVAQQEGETLLKKASHLDLVVGPDNIVELPDLVAYIRQGGPPLARTVFDYDQPGFLHAVPSINRREVSSYVTVMKGCDERCSFCIVPYTRGAERYRPADDIVAEIRQQVNAGVREVTLLGQTVNSWYEPGGESAVSSQFAALLRRINAEVPGLLRLRYTSPHPRHVTLDLVNAHAELDVLASHVHLPVQSGSDRVLKRMIRKYTRAEYIERARRLLDSRVGMTLSTDIIVGFPGETDDDFRQTLSLVREVGFVSAFAFKYSPRPHTPALKLGNDVPEEIKDERLAELFDVTEQQQSLHLSSLVGTTQRVLIESLSRDGSGRFTGRSQRNDIVHVDCSQPDPVGILLDVEIVEAYRHSLRGVERGHHSVRAVTSTPRPRRLPVAV